MSGILEQQIPLTNVEPRWFVERLVGSFACLVSDPSEIVANIKSFKSKHFHSNFIPSFIFKHIAYLIASRLSELVSESFRQGKFPNGLKSARVIPIFKPGKRDILSKYRLISTLYFLSKIIERAMFTRFANFFQRFNRISSKQF